MRERVLLQRARGHSDKLQRKLKKSIGIKMHGVKQCSSVLETGCTEHRVSANPCHELKITGIKIDFVLFRVQVSDKTATGANDLFFK